MNLKEYTSISSDNREASYLINCRIHCVYFTVCVIHTMYDLPLLHILYVLIKN